MNIGVLESPDLEPLQRGRARGLLRLMFPTWLAAVVGLLVCVAVPVAFVAVHIHRSPAFSIEDEEAHFDYVQRIAQGSVPRLGQQLLPSTNELLRCGVGRPPEAFTVPPCRGVSRAQLSAFYHSVNNAQYEAQQPPLYYAATAVLRWPLVHVLGFGTLSGTRFTGALWLIAGLLLTWLAAALLGIDWPLAAAGALFIAVAPTVVLAASIVNNDAAAVFAGGLVATIAALELRRHGWLSWWWFAAAGLIVAALKISFALAALSVSLLLLVRAVQRGRERLSLRAVLRDWLPAGGALLGGTVVGVIGWSVAFHALSLVNPANFEPLLLAADGHTGLADLAGNALAMLHPLTNTGAPLYRWTTTGATPTSDWLTTLSAIQDQMVDVVLFGVGLAWLFVSERRWEHWLGAISFPVLFFGGWVLGISIRLSYSFNSALPGRYGLPVAVLLVVALMGAVRGRLATALLAATSSAALGLTFLYMLY